MAEDERKGLWDKLAGNEKYRRVVFLVGALGIALIFLSGLIQPAQKKPEEKASEAPAAEQYAGELEARLKNMVEGISGAGSTSVMVTLERGTEQVYATQEKTSRRTGQDADTDGSRETSYILVKDADGSQKALEVTEVQPVVKGVVVVCEGGGSPTVRQDVVDAVTTALDLSSARVCVIKAK